MRYASIDLETLGLDPEHCNMIEMGVVLDDLTYMPALDRLPRFHAYILPHNGGFDAGSYHGEPFAMSMHPTILRRIATREAGFTYLEPSEVVGELVEFLKDNGFGDTLDRASPALNVAGKNFGSFDLQFCRRQLGGWDEELRIAHRSIDPGNLFWRAEDEKLPDTKKCLERAGLTPTDAHTAIGDALDVVKLIRHSYLRKLSPGTSSNNINTQGQGVFVARP